MVQINKLLALFLCVFALSPLLRAAPAASSASLTYQGRILKSDGTVFENSNVSFIFQILDPSGQCLIYQEQVSAINMANSGGLFDVPIGNGSIQYITGTGAANVVDIFNNGLSYTCGACTSSGTTYTCAAGTSSYNPIASAGRILRVSFFDGSGWQTITPDNSIRAVPYAGHSLSAQKLGSNIASDFVLKNEINNNGTSSVACSASQFVTWDGTKLTCEAVSGATGGTVTQINTGAGLTGGPITNSGAISLSTSGVTAGTYGSGTQIPIVAVDTYGRITSVSTAGLSLSDYVPYSSLPTCNSADHTLSFISPVGGFSCTAISVAAFTGSLAGDVTGTQTATVVAAIQGKAISAIAPTASQVLQYNGTQWAPVTMGSLIGITDGNNTALGSNALAVTTGNSNTAIGISALAVNTSGTNNTALGRNALLSNVGGLGNTGVGMAALAGNTSASFNTAVGFSTLVSNTTGDLNTATGYNSLRSNTSGTQNVASGASALNKNTTGVYNVAIGAGAMQNNTTSYGNSAVGQAALSGNVTGNSNTAMGWNALQTNYAKNESTAIGANSMFYADSTTTTSVSYNTAIGAYSLQGNATSSGNTGIKNTALGHSALMSVTSGSGNVGVGYNAGSAITTGSNNVVIGSNTGAGIATASNTILIADGAGNEQIRILSSGNVGIGTPSPAYTLDVNGSFRSTSNASSWSDIRAKKNIEVIPEALSKIQQLRGVTFDWRTEEFPDKKFKTTRDMGVIAQEVEKVFPEAVATAPDGYKSVAYQELVAPLIEAVKSLYSLIEQKADTTRVQALENENAKLKEKFKQAEQRNTEIEARLNRLENALGQK